MLAADRLRALYDTGLPDSAHDPATQQTFDRLTRLATRLLGVPVSLVSLVDADRQVFVGCVGLDGEAGAARETPLSHSFCQQVVTTALPVVIGDARTDPRTAPGMPGALAVRDLGVTAYAGVPLVDVDGYVLGAFCAIDQVPRAWTADDVAVLSDLAASAISEIELRRVADRARAARESAVAADVAKSTFLSTMSHEIRTPLNAIAGYVEILALEIAGPLTTQQRDYLGRLGAASDHLRSLISDVLDLAKVDAGELRVTRDVGMTHEVVAAALDLVTPQGDARGVALVDDTADTCVAYVGDADRVRQILVNLLGNAVKFTPSGGRVTVTCAVVAAHPPDVEVHGEGPWARLRVEDTGIGIPLAQQAVVFEPFRQVEGDKTVGSGGTGLGLAISRRLARRMGGDLVLASAPGVGSTFTLWLPAAGGAEETAADRGARAERPVLGAS